MASCQRQFLLWRVDEWSDGRLMLYYDIQTHLKPESLRGLLDMLAGDCVRIHVNFDMAAACPEVDRVVDFAPNTTVSVGREVSWGGASLMVQMHDALKRALKDGSTWEWFVNLSGSCIPLLPAERILEAVTTHHEDSGAFGFVGRFELKRQPEILEAGDTARDTVIQAGRVSFRCDPEIAARFEAGSFNPAKWVTQRRSLRFVESDKNTFDLIRYGQDDPRRSPGRMFFGRQWVLLHRRAVEQIIAGGVGDRVCQRLAETFIPDESFFQEAVSDPNWPATLPIHQKSLRYRNGAGGPLAVDDILEALASGALFARKVDSRRFPKLAEIIRESWK